MNDIVSQNISTKNTSHQLMGTGFIIGLILIGVFAFSALIGLSGYADDIRDKNNGQAHALSTSAIGFAGLNILLTNLGQDLSLDANEAEYFRQDRLRIYTLNSAYQTDILDELNPDAPKLIILPKWNVSPVPKAPGWVHKTPYGDEVIDIDGLASNFEALLGEVAFEQIHNEEGSAAIEYNFILKGKSRRSTTRLPRLQMVISKSLLPVLTTEEGSVIIGKIEGTKTYLLTDPDFLNTAGLRTQTQARFAMEVLDYIRRDSGANGYTLDLAIHGIGGRRNMVKLFTQPPFLSITFLLIALTALIGWQAFLRFGDPQRGDAEDFGEDMQMGPQSLTRTTAEFLGLAKRETEIMGDYASLVRSQAINELGLSGQDNQSRLKSLQKREIDRAINPTFRALKDEATGLTQKHDMTRLAKALQKWKKEITE